MNSSMPIHLKFDSRAWLLRGISTLPGRLQLAGGTVWFTATNTGSAWDWQLRKLDRLAVTTDFSQRLQLGQPAVLFRERLENLVIASPWYYFQGGLVVRSARGTWRISFGPPARASADESLAALEGELVTMAAMRRTGKHWLQVFRQAGATS